MSVKLIIEKIPDLQSLYAKQMRLLLSAAEIVTNKAPSLADAATDAELEALIRRHGVESDGQAARLREILNQITQDREPVKCKSIYALFDEAFDWTQDATSEAVRDVALSVAARRILHYELAAWEAVLQFALALERETDAQAIEASIREVSDADAHLSRITDRTNPAAKKKTF